MTIPLKLSTTKRPSLFMLPPSNASAATMEPGALRRNPFFHAPDLAEPLSAAGLLADLVALISIIVAVIGAALVCGGLAG